MIASTAEFVALLHSYRLLDSARLEEVGSVLQARFADPQNLARELLQRGWLTAYQVNQLLQGKAPNLVLGSYVLLERLGEGGMGQVFKARHQKLDRIVAIKLIRPERMGSPESLRRFQREIRAVSQLHHPHIVHALDADEVDGACMLVMEFVEGGD